MPYLHDTITITPRATAAQPTPYVCPYYADIQFRWKVLYCFAIGIIPSRIPLEPSPDDIEAIRHDLVILAHHVDALIAAYGEYLNANSSRVIDQSLFKDQLLGALEGNALFEVSEVADELRETIMENV